MLQGLVLTPFSIMAKVYPQNSSSSSSCVTAARHTFTVWMKSLVFNGNGCTVFDSKGEIVYRIDNYSRKRSREVYLMDVKGNVLATVLKRNFKMFGRWEGYNSNDSEAEEGRPWFIVRKTWQILQGRVPCEISVDMCRNQTNDYRIEGTKFGCKIHKQTGGVVAEVKRKIGRSGVALGPDVFCLVVERLVDPSLIMGLVVVYSLMTGAM